MRVKHNKAEIIQKGIEIFRDKGYHNTGVDDILKTCNIPSGSFYNFFKNKEGFAIQAIDLYNKQYFDYLDEVLNDLSMTPIERLKKAYQGNVEGHRENQCRKGCLLSSLTSEVAGTNEAIRVKTLEDYQKSNRKIALIIHEGQNIGEIRKDFKAEELADYLINGFMGAVTRMKAGQNDAPLQLFMRTAFEFIKA